MLKLSPFSSCNIFLSEKKDGSISSFAQAKKFLNQAGQFSKILYFQHHHQANRFYVNKENKFISQVKTDAVISNCQDVILAMSVADCFPVILVCQQSKTFALIHCGWKPLLQNILELTLLDLVNKYKINPHHLSAWIGPGIRECCYQFKQVPIQSQLPSWQSAIQQNKNQWQINLPLFIKQELSKFNIKENAIFDFNQCTYCYHESYFSHQHSLKNNEPDGRMLIALVPNKF